MKTLTFTLILLLIFLNLYSIYENKNIQSLIEKNTELLESVFKNTQSSINSDEVSLSGAVIEIPENSINSDNLIELKIENLEKNVSSSENNIDSNEDKIVFLSSVEIINSLTQEDFIWFLVASSPSWKVWQMKKNPKTNELLQRNLNWEYIEKYLQIKIDEINNTELQKNLLEFKQIIKEYK